jgi:hypothetical protein
MFQKFIWHSDWGEEVEEMAVIILVSYQTNSRFWVHTINTER